ncbi:MAG: hypothetical protein ABIT83_02795 [Massilia sp.]
MKNIQIFEGAENAVYDIFAATDDEFALIFSIGTDVAFIDEVRQRQSAEVLNTAFAAIWKCRVPKHQAMGIHGILFYDSKHKKVYYPTRRDEKAINPDGSMRR